MKKSTLAAIAVLLSTLPSIFAEPYARFYMFVRNASNNNIQYIMSTEPGMGYNNGWKTISGSSITTGPTACSPEEGRIDVFGRGSTGGLLHWTWQASGNAWTTDIDLGGNIVGSPDACSWGAGRLDVFARSTTNTIKHRYWTAAGGWSGWGDDGAPPVTGGATSDPGAIAYQANRLDFFVRGGDGHCWHRYWNGSWQGWEDIGGNLAGGPDVATTGSVFPLRVYARFATDNKIYRNNFDGTVWSGWSVLSGTETFSSDPTVVFYSRDRAEVFARHTDGRYMKKSWVSPAWGAWTPVSNTTAFADAPEVTVYSGDRAFVRGTYWGETSKTLSGIMGMDVRNAAGPVDQYGNASPPVGYEITINQNRNYPCRPVANAGPMNDGDTYACTDPQNHHVATHVETKNFVAGPLYIPTGETWTLFYEGYPKDASGTTTLVNWTEAVLQNHIVSPTGFTGMHLTAGAAANGASISGHLTHLGSPYANRPVRIWGRPSGSDTAFDASHTTNANGDFTMTPEKGFYIDMGGTRFNSCDCEVYAWNTSNHLFLLGVFTVTPGQQLNIGTFEVP